MAQIVTFSTIKGRQALRDSARVLGYPYAVGDRVAKAMPPPILGREATLAQALEPPAEGAESVLRDFYANAAGLRELHANDPDSRRVIDTARGLEGLRRQDSIHAAAVVICPQPITEIVPIQQKGEGAEVVTQFEMHAIEELGLLKMDFLGLRNLSTIERALELIEENTGSRPDIDRVPLDDPAVYAMLSRGDAIGIFQLEGGGMRALMRSLRPDRFEDIIALVSLYRPGPLGAGTHNLYADRKNGRVAVEYPHPDLEEVLSETYGIMVYQEQVMQAAQIMAGYSMVEADTLRKAMGKKIPAVMARQEEQFVKGCAAQGHPEGLGRRLFELISHFAGYGFNKSHAAGYALIAYQTAWLKAHFPAEYMAALLTSAKRDKDRTALYLNECRVHGTAGAGARCEPLRVGLRRPQRGGALRPLGGAQRGRGGGRPDRPRTPPRRALRRLPGLRGPGRSAGAQQAHGGVAHQGRGLRRHRRAAAGPGDGGRAGHRRRRRPGGGPRTWGSSRCSAGRRSSSRRRRWWCPTWSGTRRPGWPSRRRCSASTCRTTRSSGSKSALRAAATTSIGVAGRGEGRRRR